MALWKAAGCIVGSAFTSVAIDGLARGICPSHLTDIPKGAPEGTVTKEFTKIWDPVTFLSLVNEARYSHV